MKKKLSFKNYEILKIFEIFKIKKKNYQNLKNFWKSFILKQF